MIRAEQRIIRADICIYMMIIGRGMNMVENGHLCKSLSKEDDVI